MATAYTHEFQIELLFEKRSDGVYKVRSPSLPGLYLASEDFDALREDIEPAVKDLLYYNKSIQVENIRWVPSLDEAQQEMTKPHDGSWAATYLVTPRNVA
jgi:hypothetical protein